MCTDLILENILNSQLVLLRPRIANQIERISIKHIFSGVGKSYDEILLGIQEGILSFNVEYIHVLQNQPLG